MDSNRYIANINTYNLYIYILYAPIQDFLVLLACSFASSSEDSDAVYSCGLSELSSSSSTSSS